MPPCWNCIVLCCTTNNKREEKQQSKNHFANLKLVAHICQFELRRLCVRMCGCNKRYMNFNSSQTYITLMTIINVYGLAAWYTVRQWKMSDALRPFGVPSLPVKKSIKASALYRKPLPSNHPMDQQQLKSLRVWNHENTLIATVILIAIVCSENAMKIWMKFYV